MAQGWAMTARAGRRGRAFATILLVAALATLVASEATASEDPNAASHAPSSSHPASTTGGAEKPHELRVGDSAPRRIAANTRRPGILKLHGYPRMLQHKMFHHLTLEIYDDGGFVANSCVLHRVVMDKESDGEVRRTKVRQRKGPGHPGLAALAGGSLNTAASNASGGPTFVATFGPFDQGVTLTPRCERWRGGAAEPLSYRVRLVASDGPDTGKISKLIVGAALVTLAPVVSEMTLAYYGVGMALSVLAVAILIIYRVARALPGGRAMKAGAGASAAVAALVVPSEHLSAVVEGYVHLCLKPVSLVARAVYEQNPDEAGLPYALAATIVMLAGAAIGLWVVRRWMIDEVTGGVAPSVAGFACVAMRVVGVVLLQFCTLDLLSGFALVGASLAVTATDVARSWPGATRRSSSSSSSGQTRGAWSHGSGSVASRHPRGGAARRILRRAGRYFSDEEEDAYEEEEDGYEETDGYGDDDLTPGMGHERGSPGLGVRRRAASGRRTPGTTLSADRDERIGDRVFGDGPGSSRGGSFLGGVFGGGSGGHSGSARKRRSLPESMDPEPRTPPATIDGAGGAIGGGGGRGASAVGGLMGLFGGGKRAEKRGTAPRRSKLGGRSASSAVAAASNSPLPPVGMAAASRGRFLTASEFNAQSVRATDAGLDELCDTPEFKRWMRDNAGRIRVTSSDSDDDA